VVATQYLTALSRRWTAHDQGSRPSPAPAGAMP